MPTVSVGIQVAAFERMCWFVLTFQRNHFQALRDAAAETPLER